MTRTQYLTRAVLGLVLCCATTNALGGTVYVNNFAGNDLFDGKSAVRESGVVGPLLTLHRAVRIARFGDTIHIANTGEPYYESLTLTGAKHSGNSTVPFRVIGNGATLSGLRSVKASAWRFLGDSVWSFEPERKGRYLLLSGGKRVERFNTVQDQERPYGLPTGQFAVCRGHIFYRTAKGEDITTMSFATAQDTTGISMYAVRNVIIEDLNVQHFRVDGVNAHDLCRNVLIRRVTSTDNGRSGMTVTGSSRVVIRGCAVKENLESSLQIMERGEADVQDSELDVEPTLVR